MGLLPLEFTECLQDSPYFRDSLHSHEKELERTSNNIKELIKEVKNLLHAAKSKSTIEFQTFFFPVVKSRLLFSAKMLLEEIEYQLIWLFVVSKDSKIGAKENQCKRNILRLVSLSNMKLKVFTKKKKKLPWQSKSNLSLGKQRNGNISQFSCL